MATANDLTPAQRRLGRLLTARPITWLYRTLLAPLDPTLLRWSKGRLSFSPGVPMLLLGTTGAKSGLKRETPLAYGRDGDRIVLVASNNGLPHNPAWYYNLRANPEVKAILAGEVRQFVAHEATGTERERLWAAAIGRNPAYALYQKRTGGRTIPVLVLEPV